MPTRPLLKMASKIENRAFHWYLIQQVLTNPGRVPDKTTSNIWGDTPLQFCSSPATLCGLNYLYLSWKERQPMQRKGYNVVNKTGYKRNGKGKKKRARKEIEINSPKKKKVQLMHIREKQKRCLCLTILICLGQVQTLNFS